MKSQEKNQWNITYSYKYDLASFCNLFSRSEDLISLHEEGYDEFKDAIEGRPDLVELAQDMQRGGFDPRIVLVSAFDLVEYQGYDIEELVTVLEDKQKSRRLFDHYVIEEELVTEDIWREGIEPLLPRLAEMAKHVHENGFLTYWKENCKPKLHERSSELGAEASEYHVISEINSLLGPRYHLPLDHVTLQLSHFSAPFGTKLRGQSFLTDARWDLDDIISIALHEMIHPPFSRDKIDELAKFLWEDDLIQEAYEKQPEGSSYNTPLRFLEEHLTEGAHVFLGEKLGVIDSPLEYFVKHDQGSHVVSVIIYDHLKKKDVDEHASFEETIHEMKEKRILYPGELRKEYRRIYDESGVEPVY